MINFLFEQLKKDEEIASLNSLINSNPDPRELKRALAVLRAIEGHPYRIISQMLGVSEFFVGHWKKAFKAEGLQGIKLGYQGKKGYLDPNQLARTIEWLTSKEHWHLEDLVNYLDREYDVVYKSKQSYYDLFSSARISWKKFVKVNPKFDEELVKKKTAEINSFLARHSSEIEVGEMIVFFIDECHLLNGDICGYVWGRTNTKVEIPIKNEKERQTYFGALNYQTLIIYMPSLSSGKWRFNSSICKIFTV